MDSSRWDRIKSLFFRKDLPGQNSTLPAEERSTLAQVRRLQAFAFGSSLSLNSEESTHPVAASLTPVFENGVVVAARFQVIQRLGRGGMGEVYQALDTVNGTKVAIKVLRSDIDLGAQATERLLRREFLLSQRISHPNICRVNDLYLHQAGSQSFFVVSMEFIAGRTLADIFAERGRLPLSEVQEIALQLIAGLQAAHSARIVHRDLKPSNVMVVDEAANGPSQRVIITDFGLARSDRDTASSLTDFRGFAGTLRYMAPEQIEGHADFRSDIYAVCLILYEMLTGAFPFSGSTGMAVALNRLALAPRDPAYYLPEIPLNWRLALLQGLSRDPNSRFQNANQLGQALADPPHNTRLRALWAYRQLRTHWAIIAASLVLLTAAVSIPLLLPRQQPKPPTFSSLLFTGLTHAPTSDPVLSSAELTLLTSLRQSPHLSVSTTTDTAATFRRMGKSDIAHLLPADLREAALRTGRKELLMGSISKDAKYHLRLELQSVDPNPAYAGKTVQQNFAATDAKDMFRAVGDAAQWVRQQSGESARELFEQNVRPADLTTTSWDALHLLQEARLRRDANDTTSALTFLDEALSLDPNFAAAESLRGDILSQLRKHREGIAAYQHALALVKQRNITGRERFQIETAYYVDTGNSAALPGTLKEWIAHFPNDYLPRHALANVYYELGDFPHALFYMQSAQKIEPDNYVIYPHLAAIYLALGQTEDARQCATKLRSLNEPEWATQVDGMTFAAQSRFDEAATQFRSLLNKDEFWKQFDSLCLANVLGSAGRLSEAEKVLRDLLSPTEEKQQIAEQTLAIAYLHWLQQDFAGVRTALPPILADLDNPETLSEAGALLARAGDLKGAQAAMHLLNRWPEVTLEIEARQRLQAELVIARNPARARQVVEPIAAGQKSPVVLDLLLYATHRALWLDEQEKVRQEIVRRPSRLLNWGEWAGVPGLYWLARCRERASTLQQGCPAAR